jgi:hypothetical protein
MCRFATLMSHPHYIIFMVSCVFLDLRRGVDDSRLFVQPRLPYPYRKCYRPSLTGMRLDLLAALSTLVPIISSSIRVISSMFFPVLVLGGGKNGFGLVGEADPFATRLTLLLSLRL